MDKSNPQRDNRGKCALCDEEDVELKESHSIQKFVYRWLKGPSASPYLRGSDDVNTRDQDGQWNSDHPGAANPLTKTSIPMKIFTAFLIPLLLSGCALVTGEPGQQQAAAVLISCEPLQNGGRIPGPNCEQDAAEKYRQYSNDLKDAKK